jgi:hypothetical protein
MASLRDWHVGRLVEATGLLLCRLVIVFVPLAETGTVFHTQRQKHKSSLDLAWLCRNYNKLQFLGTCSWPTPGEWL